MTGVGEVYGDHGGFELGVPQATLDEPGMNAGFAQMGSVRMPQGMDGHAHVVAPGPPFGFAEGPLDTSATHGEGRCGTLCLLPAGGGTEPGWVTMGFPGGSQEREGLLG
jgi:hypothetical protein